MEIRYFWVYLYNTYFIHSQDKNNSALKEKLDKELREKILKIFPEPSANTAIPTYQMNEINDAKVEELIKKKEPFIVKNFFADSYAVDNWSLDYFVEKYGDIPVLCGDPDQNIHGFQALKSVREGDTYIRNVESLFLQAPELVKHLELERLGTYKFDQNNWLHSIQLFISNSMRARSAYHNAKMDNFFIMVHGKKKWWFVNPVYTHVMKPYFNKGMGYFESRVGNPEEANPDIPLYHHLPVMEGELEAGDLLFSPPLWWHAVKNTTPDNIAIATRWYPSALETYYPLSLLQIFNHRFMSIKLRFVSDVIAHLKKYKKMTNYHPDRNYVSSYNPETKQSLFEEASHQEDYQHFLKRKEHESRNS